MPYRTEVVGVNENWWSTNGLRYDNIEEAKKWLDNLAMRWFGYDMSRVVDAETPEHEEVNLEKNELYQDFRRQNRST